MEESFSNEEQVYETLQDAQGIFLFKMPAKCTICNSGTIEYACVPCGHAYLCKGCAMKQGLEESVKSVTNCLEK